MTPGGCLEENVERLGRSQDCTWQEAYMRCHSGTHFLPVASLQLEVIKLTRKNADVEPFVAGGDAQLEHLGRRADAALFAVGTSTKKRPHNLTLGGRRRSLTISSGRLRRPSFCTRRCTHCRWVL